MEILIILVILINQLFTTVTQIWFFSRCTAENINTISRDEYCAYASRESSQ